MVSSSSGLVPGYILKLVNAKDIAELAEVESAAMLPQPMNTCCFLPTVSAEQQQDFFRTLLQHRWDGATSGATDTFFLKAINQSSGSIKGFVVWSLRRGGRAETEGGDDNNDVVETNGEIAQTRTAERLDPRLNPDVQRWRREGDAMNKRCSADFTRYVYLDKMYVRPRSQRAGTGSTLWREGPLAYARKMAAESGCDAEASTATQRTLPIMVQAIGGARSFYQGCGMISVDKFVVDLEGMVGEGADFGKLWFTNLVSR